ncbi:MAG: large conductance mechanosensitive channel protein MscL [Chitinophagaceae bacterium]|nr:large conductance mechanosensitive channel protein MscL [Chitinophagaceae bacterium]MBK8310098.1 large conductance mechanosensitive channel protein MscL [Chitinophagaceae bacterium]MBK8607086.1 large conductance mechanosensitive channel protein MscL [Chitinophagaceae bacterium]MBP6478340.1 large conductance mechanosensitive channel protein MscL [Chitinophagaceae bacterium]MBP7107466.1 large conductance mechanosensitive channel protein MscL [Chitinophagaceae bacterium]
MGMIKEFKDFAMKGNVVDLAVAVIIGGAFGAIVTALVDKILMPIIGSLIGQSFDSLTAIVNGVPIQYGAFIQAVINFIIIAFVLFMIIKVMNSTKKKEEAAPAATPEDIALLREIRDSLKK